MMIYLFRELERASYQIVRVEKSSSRLCQSQTCRGSLTLSRETKRKRKGGEEREKVAATLLKALPLPPCQGGATPAVFSTFSEEEVASAHAAAVSIERKKENLSTSFQFCRRTV